MTSNKLLLVALFLLLGHASRACNSCSQVSGFSNSGYLLQNMLTDFVSLQSQCANFRGRSTEGEISKDNLYTTELLLKKGIGKRIYIWAALPIHYNFRTFNADHLRNIGLGDVRISADYRFNNKRILGIDVLPIISMGLKAPTGKYEHYLPSQGMPRSFNLGTGAWGGLVNPLLMLRYKKWGAIVGGTYFTQTKNKYDYRYGSQLNFSANAYYTFFAKTKFRLIPSMGIMLDKITPDNYKGQEETQTSGRSSLLQFGLSAQTNRSGFALEYRKPLSQEYADNNVVLKNVYSASYTFLLKRRNKDTQTER